VRVELDRVFALRNERTEERVSPATEVKESQGDSIGVDGETAGFDLVSEAFRITARSVKRPAALSSSLRLTSSRASSRPLPVLHGEG